jgi:5-oxoprolinase (ATP-hydrolysing)
LCCRFAGILSAFGMGLADVVKEQQQPCAVLLAETAFPELASKLSHLDASVKSDLLKQSFARDAITTTLFVHLR